MTITQRFLTVIGLVGLAIIIGLLAEALLSIRFSTLFGHTQQGHMVGWIGLAVMLSVFVYSVKKRQSQRQKSAWPKGWFWVHQVAGVVAPVLILIHAGSHFHALVPLLALVTMGIVALTGLIGVAVHRKALGLLKNTRQELLSQGLSPEVVEAQLYDLASSEETFRLWQLIHVPMVILFLVLLTAHILGALYYGGL
ncbi:MAG: hypothetical protein ABL903_06535 [Methylococcales bacterium]